MNRPTLAPRFIAAVLLAAATLTACNVSDSVPTAVPSTLSAGGSTADRAPAPLALDDTAKAVLTIEPGKSYDVMIGTHRLTIPANSICDIATSGYGASAWNSPCTPSTTPVTITAKSHASVGGLPVVEFTPALRFAPENSVMLYLYIRHPRQVATNWQIVYCATDKTSCVREDEATYWNNAEKTVYRRIKHFSGYMVSE